MTNRIEFLVKEYPSDNPKEYVIVARATADLEEALIAVFPSRHAANIFAAAMNHSMDLADGHPRQPSAY